MPTKIIMPKLGESVVEGTITRWLKQEGETVEEMESLLEVNTDKVDTEIPSPAAGTLIKITVPEGETVRAGTIVAWIGKPGEEIPGGEDGPRARAPEVQDPGAGKSAQAIEETVTPITAVAENEAPVKPVSAPVPPAVPAAPSAGRHRDLGFISPIVARLAQEHQLDLTQISGTGEGGRITKKDVLAYLEKAPEKARDTVAAGVEAAAPWETPGEGDLFRPTDLVFNKQRQAAAQAAKPQASEGSPAQPKPAQPISGLPGEDRLIPHSTMRRRIAEHMVNSKRTSPHVTTVMEADLHRVVEHFNANREAFARDGARLTYTAYFVAATVQALKAHPLVNSSWTEEGVLIHPRVNIGLAVSLGEEGLIVPVLKNVDSLSLLGLARAIADAASRARGRQLQAEDVRDGTFTITNHGITGSLFATPVINQPQCGILGVGAIQKRVVVTPDDAIAIRPMVYLSLTFDHRILDGAAADGFLSTVVEALEEWR
jgi:2-oxoglutarate dehydrogenase E2 component (dihydrolipoamide succinyltransferase)